MNNYFFDAKTKEYLKTRPAQISKNGSPLPALNSTFIEPPALQEKQQAVWNGASWDVVEDHRQKPDGRGGKKDGTAYWLPEDTWQSPERYMTELGSLPENALLVAPEKTQEEINEDRKREIRSRLFSIDNESLRPLRAAHQGTATDYDINKLASLESEAVALREELSNL